MTAIEPVPLVTPEDFQRLAREATAAETRVAKLAAELEAARDAPVAVEGVLERDLPPSLVSDIKASRWQNVREEQWQDLTAAEMAAHLALYQLEAARDRQSVEAYLQTASLRPEAAALVSRCALASPVELERFAERAAATGDVHLAGAVDAVARGRKDLGGRDKDAIYGHLRALAAAIPARTAVLEQATAAHQAAARALAAVARMRADGVMTMHWARRAEAPVW